MSQAVSSVGSLSPLLSPTQVLDVPSLDTLSSKTPLLYQCTNNITQYCVQMMSKLAAEEQFESQADSSAAAALAEKAKKMKRKIERKAAGKDSDDEDAELDAVFGPEIDDDMPASSKNSRVTSKHSTSSLHSKKGTHKEGSLMSTKSMVSMGSGGSTRSKRRSIKELTGGLAKLEKKI